MPNYYEPKVEASKPDRTKSLVNMKALPMREEIYRGVMEYERNYYKGAEIDIHMI